MLFTEAELRDMARLRSELSDILTPDLDTDFNIHRWVHGWHGDLAEASRRFRAYIENRKVAQLDDPNYLEVVHSHPIIKKYAHFFSFNIAPLGINPLDNTVMVLQRFQGVDYHTMTRVMTCSQFLALYFVTCEWNLRQVLKCEAETGRKSGMTMIFDLDHFPLLHYANPHSAIYRIFMLCLCLLQDYYCDMLHRLVIVNAPVMVNMVLAIVKKFLRPATQKKFVTVSHKEDLFKYIDPSVLPVRYGGHLRLESDTLVLGGMTWHVDPDSATLVPRSVSEGDLFLPRAFKHKAVIESIGPRDLVTVRHLVEVGGARLFWQFMTSAEVQFTIVYESEDGQKHRLIPFWTVITPKLPEVGSLICAKAGGYALEFFNPHTGSSSVKVEYMVDIE